MKENAILFNLATPRTRFDDCIATSRNIESGCKVDFPYPNPLEFWFYTVLIQFSQDLAIELHELKIL